MWYLIALTGPDAGRTFAFVDRSIVLGRAGTPDHDLQYPSDARLSREHATLRATDHGVIVDVLPGRGAATRDGVEVSSADVPWDGEFTLGATRFRALRAPPEDPDVPRRKSPLLPRRTLDEFELGEECGSGLSSRVHRATDKATGTVLALKIFRKELFAVEPAMALFVREMEIHAPLRHPNIVRILCVGRDRAELFIGVEWVEGCDLQERVATQGPLSPADACGVGIGILDALAYTHAQGLVHRDIKPSNVMLATKDPLVPRVVDFGMAKHLRPSGTVDTLTYTGEVRGTLLFSPPECLVDAKRARPAADLFALGTTLYFALTGKPWFDDERYIDNYLPAIQHADLVPLRERNARIPADLADVVEGAIQADPDARWKTAEEMSSLLRTVESNLGDRPS